METHAIDLQLRLTDGELDRIAWTRDGKKF